MPRSGLSPNLADSADANFLTHISWAARHTSGMRVIEDPDLVLVDSGLACDTFNVVAGSRLTTPTAPTRVRAAIAHFTIARRPFSWWVGPADRPHDLGDLLVAAGLERAEAELAMTLALDRLDPTEGVPAGLRIRRVRTADALGDFARVTAANWSPPDPNVVRFYERAASALLDAECPLWLYVGYVGDIPVATAELTVAGGVVGLYGVATLESYRRRGFGSALTRRPLLDARDAGHQVAVLQASPDGAGVYERLGFEPFGKVAEFKPTGPD